MRIPLYQIDAFAEGRLPAIRRRCARSMPGCRPKRCRRSRPRKPVGNRVLCPEGDDYRLRWFTPSVEVDLCGHATLASAFVVFRYLAPKRDSITFQTEKAGRLTVGRDGDDLVLDFPARPALPCPMSEAVAAALGRHPAALLASPRLSRRL